MCNFSKASLNSSSFGVLQRKKRITHCITTCSRKVKVNDFTQERIWDLGQNTGPITSTCVRTNSTTVLEVTKRAQRDINDVVSWNTTQSYDHGQATGVFL